MRINHALKIPVVVSSHIAGLSKRLVAHLQLLIGQISHVVPEGFAQKFSSNLALARARAASN